MDVSELLVNDELSSQLHWEWHFFPHDFQLEEHRVDPSCLEQQVRIEIVFYKLFQEKKIAEQRNISRVFLSDFEIG